MTVLGLRFCMRAFSSGGERGLPSSCAGFCCWGAWALVTWVTVVVVRGSSSCDS